MGLYIRGGFKCHNVETGVSSMFDDIQNNCPQIHTNSPRFQLIPRVPAFRQRPRSGATFNSQGHPPISVPAFPSYPSPSSAISEHHALLPGNTPVCTFSGLPEMQLHQAKTNLSHSHFRPLPSHLLPGRTEGGARPRSDALVQEGGARPARDVPPAAIVAHRAHGVDGGHVRTFVFRFVVLYSAGCIIAPALL